MVVVASACLVAVISTTASAAAKVTQHHVIATRATIPLRTAFFDRLFESPDGATAFPMAEAAGASYVRLPVPWRSIAPATPDSTFVATDPTSPGYTWAGLDFTVENAGLSGLTPILDIVGTPDWAYKLQPTGVNAGTPNISDLSDFAVALASHYDGLTDGIPAEHVFQVWNEANNSLDLNPASASTYRAMVNAVSDAVHGVDPTSLVVAGSLDPFGHPKTKKQAWYSVAPLTFMRSLLCLSKGAHPHATCDNPARFDVWSHHPYTFGGPFGHAKQPDNVELGDLPRMRALLQVGARLHHVVSANPVEFWVTEFGWDTNPPRPHAASLSLAARWTAESLHQMWLSGVSLVTWFLLEDYPSPSPYQSGLLLLLALSRGRACEARLDRVPFPVRRLPAKEDGQHLGPRRDQRQAGRDDSAPARQGRSVANGGAGLGQLERHLPGEVEAPGDEEGLAPSGRSGLRQLSRVLAHPAQGSEHRALGQLATLPANES
jgi:hypothetical protein